MVILPLTIDQLPIYGEVIRRSFTTVRDALGITPERFPTHTSFITDARLAERYKDGYHPYGLFEDEVLVGFVSLGRRENGAYELNNLAVVPEYRHCGYGKMLLTFCKKQVAAFGGKRILISIIEENTVLKNWYIRNGFVPIGTRKLQHFTAGYMEWIRTN